MKILYYGDNLQIMRDKLEDESIDLIYLDPPFNSQKPYNIVFGAEAQIKAFDDTWVWADETLKAFYEIDTINHDLWSILSSLIFSLGKTSLTAYLVMMGIRLVEIHRILKPTGSIYLHCDPHACRYLGILMDLIFGINNFQNQIVWQRTSAHSGTKGWSRIQDNILFYTKSDNYTWNYIKKPLSEGYIENFYKFEDKNGRRFRHSDLTAPNVRKGESGKPWRGVDPTAKGRHWAIPGYLRDLSDMPKSTLAALDHLEKIGRIHWPSKGGAPSVIRYLDEMEGGPMTEIITDIPPLSPQSKERLGYPTQKPSALLERIIKCSSNPGDIVLDPFCGCGTAIAAAEALERNWIGIDITHLAIALIEKRLDGAFSHKYAEIGTEGEPQAIIQKKFYNVEGTPKYFSSAEDLARRDKHQFQYWACSLVNAMPHGGAWKKGADKGIDGLIFFRDDIKSVAPKKIIVSVQGGEHVKVDMVRQLLGVITREQASMGLLLTLVSPTKEMTNEAMAAGFYQSPSKNEPLRKIQILTVKELLEGKYPDLPPDFTVGLDGFKKAAPVHARHAKSRLEGL